MDRNALDVVVAMGLVRLTDWDTGDAVYVDRALIVSMRRLTASHSSTGSLRELGGRTRIDTKTDVILVRETPDEIMDAK